MDRKKYIEYPKKFNRNEYNTKYQKDHYAHFSTVIKPDIKERIDNYCTDKNISKSEFLRRAIDMFENEE